MKRVFHFLLSAMALIIPAHAQQPVHPVVETVLENTSVVPGQYVTMRITVLVPTWLSEPIDFPSFEVPNVRVRLGDRSTTAVSRLVNGQSWSGVSRQYTMSPMIAGAFVIPAQDLPVSYAEPGKPSAVRAVVKTAPLRLAGIVPQKAEQLRPFIAGTSVTLRQELSGDTTGLRPGDSLTRTVTAIIKGASPIILPQLIHRQDLTGLRAYPKTPQVVETEDNGVLSGQRTETVTYMAQDAVNGAMPPIELEWFNLASQSIEIASVPGFVVAVEGIEKKPESTHAKWARGAAAVASLLALIFLLAGSRSRLRLAWKTARQRRQASKSYMRRKLLNAISQHNFSATVQNLDAWSKCAPLTARQDLDELNGLVLAISESLYGINGGNAPDVLWRRLAHKIRTVSNLHAANQAFRVLRPLNTFE